MKRGCGVCVYVLLQAVEETLDKVVRLLAYIADKDLFAEFYRKKLSRRLLFDKCANEEHERVMLQALKQQFGAQFTSKMEGMVTDLQLARDNQQVSLMMLPKEKETRHTTSRLFFPR